MKAAEAKIPALFDVSSEYQFDPNGVELGHTSATERLLYSAITEAAQARFRVSRRPLAILDVCAASGGCANEVLKKLPCDQLCLVDIESVMCEAAEKRRWPTANVSIHQADAVAWKADRQFDLILMNSAYHHIEDARKATFLLNMRPHLRRNGRILVGEHFLPYYHQDSLESYRQAVMQFYEARIAELQAKGDSQSVIDVIRQTGRYCWERRYEFQVCMDLFHSHARQAGLDICDQQRVWPSGLTPLPPDSGSFLVQLQFPPHVHARDPG